MLKTIHKRIKNILVHFQSISLLLARLIIAYGFFHSIKAKWGDTITEFGNLGIPLPTFNIYLVASIEALGVVLLTLGLFTRLISIPLMVIMVVAIVMVHLPHGFEAGSNGFEIPLYYMLFLFVFFSNGAGKFSLDHLIFGKDK